MNLHNALNQCRTARRHGRISSEVQQRTLRRLLRGQDGPEPITLRRWGSLMALRAKIEREIAPRKEELRAARYELFFFKEDMPNPQGRQAYGAKVKGPPPIDPTLTPEWWKEAEKREKAAALCQA